MNNYNLSDLQVGKSVSFSVTLSLQTLVDFVALTGDCNPIHVDAAYAKSAGYQDILAPGLLTSAFLSRLVGVYLPGQKALLLGAKVDFPNPSYPADILTYVGDVIEVNTVLKFITLKVRATNQRNEQVLRGELRVGVRNE